jgi:hypothetical protein
VFHAFSDRCRRPTSTSRAPSGGPGISRSPTNSNLDRATVTSLPAWSGRCCIILLTSK